MSNIETQRIPIVMHPTTPQNFRRRSSAALKKALQRDIS